MDTENSTFIVADDADYRTVNIISDDVKSSLTDAYKTLRDINTDRFGPTKDDAYKYIHEYLYFKLRGTGCDYVTFEMGGFRYKIKNVDPILAYNQVERTNRTSWNKALNENVLLTVTTNIHIYNGETDEEIIPARHLGPDGEGIPLDAIPGLNNSRKNAKLAGVDRSPIVIDYHHTILPNEVSGEMQDAFFAAISVLKQRTGDDTAQPDDTVYDIIHKYLYSKYRGTGLGNVTFDMNDHVYKLNSVHADLVHSALSGLSTSQLSDIITNVIAYDKNGREYVPELV